MPHHGDIGDIRRGGEHTVGQPCHSIDADMDLHSEELLISLPGLLHLRITLLRFVLGERCRHHNSGVNDSTLAHEQALFC